MMTEPTLNSTSWADQVEEGELHALPESKITFDGNIKRVISYKRTEEGQLQKLVQTFKIEKRRASKSVAMRKTWKKYGLAERDGPGPNPATTTVNDEIFMNFVTNKEELNNQPEEDPLQKLKSSKMGMCRVCQGDHWTTKCPYKDTLENLRKELSAQEQEGGTEVANKVLESSDQADGPKPASTGKYIPPAAREGGKRRGEAMSMRKDEGATIRVTNLSEDTRESDLKDLFNPFGSIQRIFLAMDRVTNTSKGFAFITFYDRNAAEKAISKVSGYGYDHLILNVEWAKPSGTH
ncbi:Eukaryotic translation initiation factor 3 subunit G [Holothuria leucospilota]|uniref:Eukaryotic translation initiation factor 3 subunit G n=1 Tax=Holothuria leucospilota TaxID=206669 RepID=A0A9Q1H9X9_HOLLE|nr:Eukaryotic translation initiation factor 3 subunit G [Holothuria leucospilota]